MSEVTVSQFANVLKIPVERLISQLDEAGISVSGADDVISDDAKKELLSYLRRAHGQGDSTLAVAPKKITLSRRSQTEIKVASAQGRAKTVSVEVRKKRTYINRGVLEQEARTQQDELDRQRQEEQARVAREQEEVERRQREEMERREREQAEAEALRRAELDRLAAAEAAKVTEAAKLQRAGTRSPDPVRRETRP